MTRSRIWGRAAIFWLSNLDYSLNFFLESRLVAFSDENGMGVAVSKNIFPFMEYGDFSIVTHKNGIILVKILSLMNAMAISGELRHFCTLRFEGFLMDNSFSAAVAFPRT